MNRWFRIPIFNFYRPIDRSDRQAGTGGRRPTETECDFRASALVLVSCGRREGRGGEGREEEPTERRGTIKTIKGSPFSTQAPQTPPIHVFRTDIDFAVPCCGIEEYLNISRAVVCPIKSLEDPK